MVLSPPLDQVQGDTERTVQTVITPSAAQSFSICAYRFAHEKKAYDTGNHALAMGQWLHELIRHDNQARIDGRSPSIAEIIDDQKPPPSLTETSSTETWALDRAADGLRGYRAFLDAQGIEVVLDAERYVRTPPRPVIGVSGCSIVLAGRFDVTGMRRDRSIACIDVKTGKIPHPAQLADAAASFIYHHLTEYAYGSDRIDIVQVNPLTGQWASACLDDAHIEAGKDFCRRMAAAIKEGAYPPTPGDYCGYCTLATLCPAHLIHRDGWDSPF